MDERHFNLMLDEIYSAFGSERPSCTHAGYRPLWRRICDERAVPNDAAKAIAYNIVNDRDSLPRNLGKAILAEYEKWRAEHPELQTKARSCPECDSSPCMAGWFWAWKPDGSRWMLKCSCNQDTRPKIAEQPAYSHKSAVAAGFLLYDPLALPQDERVYLPPAFSRAIGHTEPPRPDHLAQLDYAEAYAENW